MKDKMKTLRTYNIAMLILLPFLILALVASITLAAMTYQTYGNNKITIANLGTYTASVNSAQKVYPGMTMDQEFEFEVSDFTIPSGSKIKLSFTNIKYAFLDKNSTTLSSFDYNAEGFEGITETTLTIYPSGYGGSGTIMTIGGGEPTTYIWDISDTTILKAKLSFKIAPGAYSTDEIKPTATDGRITSDVQSLETTFTFKVEGVSSSS